MKKLLILYAIIVLGCCTTSLTLKAQRTPTASQTTTMLINKLREAENLGQPKTADTLARQLHTLALRGRDFKGIMTAIQAIRTAQIALHRQIPREIYVLLEETATLPWLQTEARALVRAYQANTYAWARDYYHYRDHRDEPSAVEEDGLLPDRWSTKAIREREDSLMRLALADVKPLSRRSPIRLVDDREDNALDKTDSYAQQIFALYPIKYQNEKATNLYLLDRLKEYYTALPIGMERFWAEYLYLSTYHEQQRSDFSPHATDALDLLRRYEAYALPVASLSKLIRWSYPQDYKARAEAAQKHLICYQAPALAGERKKLEEEIKNLRRPHFEVGVASHYIIGHKQQRLYLSHTLIDSCKISLYKAPVLPSGTFPKPGQLQLISERTHRFTPSPTWQNETDTLTLEFPQTGCYYLQIIPVNSKEAHAEHSLSIHSGSYLPIQVTGKFVVLHEPNAGGRYEMQWFNAISGKPLSGERFELHLGKDTTLTLKTDASGIAWFSPTQLGQDTAKPNEYRLDQHWSMNYKSLDPNDAVEFYSGWRSLEPKRERLSLKGFLSSDRGLYRPGDKMHFFGYVASEGTSVHNHRVYAGKKIKLALQAPNSEEVFHTELVTDSWGGFSYTHEAPSKLPKGGYTLRASAAGQSLGRYRLYIEEYKAPSFNISMSLPESVALGELVSIPVRIKDFTGMPLAGVSLKPEVSGRRESYNGQIFHRVSLPIAELSIEPTNAAGETVLRFRHQVPDLADKQSQPMLEDMANYDIKLQGTSSTGEVVVEESTLTLPIGLPQRLKISVDEYIRLDGEQPQLYVGAMEMDNNRDRRYPLTYTLSSQGVVRYTGRASTGDSIALRPVLGKLPSGRYTLTAEAEIAPKQRLKEQMDITLYRSGDKHIALGKTLLWAQEASKTFNEQAPPQVFFAASLTDTYVSYRVSVDGSEVDRGGLTIKANELHRITAKVSRENTNTVVEVYAVRFGKLERHRFSFAYAPPVSRELELRWESFRDRIRSGSQEEWRLRILNDGKPVAASLTAWMYDDALNQIAPQRFVLPYLSPRTKPNSLQLKEAFEDPWASHIFSPELYPKPHDDKHFGTFFHLAHNGSPADCRTLGEVDNYDRSNLIFEPAMMADNGRSSSRALYTGAVEDNKVFMVGQSAAAAKKSAPGKATIRANLTPLAFCRPMMQTDKAGRVSWSFQLPDVLTRWRLELVAHTEDMRTGHLSTYVESYRDLMVRPFLPRQLRQGDKASLATQVQNASSKRQQGELLCELFLLDTEEVIMREQRSFALDPQRGESFDFALEVPKGLDSIGVRLVAKTKDFSDGEQHVLKILPASEPLTLSQAFTLTQAGAATFSLASLYPTGDFRPEESMMSLRVESNPLFLALEALPPLSEPWSSSALSLSTAIYTRALASHLVQTPGLRSWVEARSQSLGLPLRKDRDTQLAIPIEETPWAKALKADERREAELLHFLAQAPNTDSREEYIAQLIKLQGSDGQWSWFPGMRGSYYITSSVLPLLLRSRPFLSNAAPSTQSLDSAIAKGGQALAKEMKDIIAEWRAPQKQAQRQARLYRASMALDYLYLLTLDTKALIARDKGTEAYLLSELSQWAHQLPLYDKARAAIVLHQSSPRTAKLLLESLRQHLSTAEVGAFFDQISSAYGYWWRNRSYPLVTEFVEALQLIEPQEHKTVQDLRAWLLNQRRSVRWESDLASVEAIQALLSGSGAQALQRVNRTEVQVVLSNGRNLRAEGERIGLSRQMKAGVHPVDLAAQASQDGQVWGSITLQYDAPIEMLSASGKELRLERKHFIKRSEGGNATLLPIKEGAELRVGDIIVTQIYLVLNRDMDFVTLSDPRLGCTEPAHATSGMTYGAGTLYYYEPRDRATNFYFEQLNRGAYRLEYEQYVVREGVYQAPSAQAQSTYAPEYTATSGFGGRLHVRQAAKPQP